MSISIKRISGIRKCVRSPIKLAYNKFIFKQQKRNTPFGCYMYSQHTYIYIVTHSNFLRRNRLNRLIKRRVNK